MPTGKSLRSSTSAFACRAGISEFAATGIRALLTEMTDIMGSAFLGLSLHCSRCHDHMFDPIKQKDYYRLQAFLAASQENNITLAGEADQQAWQQKTDALKAKIKILNEKLRSIVGAARKPCPPRTVFEIRMTGF